jgi:hypothetical protein
MNSLFDDDEFGTSRANAPAEKHLRSPILSSLLERVIEYYKAIITVTKENRFYDPKKIAMIDDNFRNLAKEAERKNARLKYASLPAICEPFLVDMRLTTSPPKILTPDHYPEWFRMRIKQRSPLQDSVAFAHELYKEEIIAFKHWAKTPELEKLADSELNWATHLREETYAHYESYRYWDIVVERYRKRKLDKRFGTSSYVVNDRKFHFYDGFIMEQVGDPVLIHDEHGKVVRRIAPSRYIYTFEQAQMFQDCALARFNAFLAIDAGMHNGSRKTHALLSRLLLWQEEILIKYGNRGYELVKGPESIYKSYLTELTDGDILPISSFVRTCAKLMTKEEKLNDSSEHPLVLKLIEIVKDTDDLSTSAELFGCTKLSGHPFVYAAKSAKSVREEACPKGKLDLVSIRQYHNHFKFLVLQRYLTKNKTWPEFVPKCEPRRDTKLHELWTQDILYLPQKSFPLSDLDDVEFKKFMEFDYSPDYLDMIDDKAICPGGQHASGFWFGGNSSAYRRLLESLIKRKDVDTFDIVERMRRGKFHINQRIVELTQKEREFKTSARCFAKLEFEVRLFFVLTEANLKRFMGGENGDDGYLPQQTMTMSNTKLRKRLYDLTAEKARNNTCLVEVDFSRWNLRWRAASVNPIARSLEHIFGLPGVFSQAHKFFSSCTFVLTDKHTLPEGVKHGMHAKDWPTSDLVWRNHYGGIEGIQQTLWTICTVAMMFFSLQNEDCSFHMAGQGDNQVFYVSFDITRTNLQTSLFNFLHSLERGSERLNHEVKPEECIDSKTVLTYGKELYVQGVHILYSLKFSSRAFSRLDHSVPSLTKEIAGVVSNSIAVAGTLNNSLRAIWWKFVQVFLMLQRRRSSLINEPEWHQIDRLLANKTARKILLIPGSVGGLPMMPWTRYFSKGETDDLSFDVAATYHLSQHTKSIRNYMSLLLTGEFMPHKIDPTNLINDPYSIPIDKPDDASHLIADEVGKQLPSIVVNRDLAAIVKPTLRVQGEKYKKYLTEMDPLHPQIASDLFDLTPAGLYNKTVKRFSMTRTIEKIVPGSNLVDRIAQAGGKILSVLIERFILSLRIDGKQHPPPFETATRLRQQWGLKFENSSIGVYTPFDFQIGPFTEKRDCISASVTLNTDILRTKGSAPPNFGTSTAKKLSDHGYRIVSCNSTMRDLKKAVIIYSELLGDKSLTSTVDTIIRARSPWSLDQLLPIFPTVYGGTGIHRHQGASHRFSVLGSCSVPTHLTFSSDRAGILSGGESDYPVVFQTNFLTLTNLYQNLSAKNIPLPPSLAYYIPESLTPIDTRPSKLRPENQVLISWPRLEGNKLAWVEDMYATEVPVIPSPDVIPHITTKPNKLDLVYSYIESVISPKLESKKIWDGILDTTDMFDFKEISRVDPRIVEIALSWTILTDVYFESISSEIPLDRHEPLKNTFRRKSMIYAGEWVRIRLHPMFLNSRYNARRMIAMQPTEHGYKRPVEFMATQLRRLCKDLLDHNTFPPEVVLFNNWKQTAGFVAKRRMILACIIGMHPNVDLPVVHEIVKRNTPPRQLLARDPATYVKATTKRLPRQVRDLEFIFPVLPIKFYNKSPQEAFRELRDEEKITEVRNSHHLSPIYTNHGITTYRMNSMYGSLPPNTDKQYVMKRETRARVLLRRTVGVSTPLYSDWNAVLSHMLSKISKQNFEVHAFGVGRGATGRFFTSHGIKTIGYDLLSTFPQISHRSSSYIPPEVCNYGNPKLFLWSDHTHSQAQGNVLEGHLDYLDEENAIAIVDLDIDLEKLLVLLSKFKIASEYIVRFRGHADEIKYLISVVQPKTIYTLAIDDGVPTDVVLYTVSSPVIGQGNFDNVEYTKIHELSYTNREHELLLQLWNTAPRLCRELEIDPAIDRYTDVARTLLTVQRTRLDDLPEPVQYLHRLLNMDILVVPNELLRTKAVCQNLLTYADVI